MTAADEDGATFQSPAGRTRDVAILTVATLACLIPFINKPFHVDDPLFLWTAEQIRRDPTDFYGFDVVWYFSEARMVDVMKNPPLLAYYLAAISSVFGRSEGVIHFALLPAAISVVLGTYRFARRHIPNPTTAALMTLFSPVFLVSATNVMCDVAMLAFFVWAVALWDEGLTDRSPRKLFLGAFLAGLAGLTKYFGVASIPLLALMAVTRRPARWVALIVLALPVGMAIGFEAWTQAKYGVGLFADAASYATRPRAEIDRWPPRTLFVGTAFCGALLAPATLASLFAWKPKVLAWGIACTAAAAAALAVMPKTRMFLMAEGPLGAEIGIHLAIEATLGISLFALAGLELWRRRDPLTITLVAWIGGTLVFASILNWTVSGRSILPMAPAAGILVARSMAQWSIPCRWGAWLAIGVGGAIAFWAAVSDERAAAIGKQAAAKILATPGMTTRGLYFQGHWGFQYYMQKGGARPFGERDASYLPGDALIIPRESTNTLDLPATHVRRVGQIRLGGSPFLQVHHKGYAAGFYSTVLGPLPLRFGLAPDFEFDVYRFIQPMGIK